MLFDRINHLQELRSAASVLHTWRFGHLYIFGHLCVRRIFELRVHYSWIWRSSFIESSIHVSASRAKIRMIFVPMSHVLFSTILLFTFHMNPALARFTNQPRVLQLLVFFLVVHVHAVRAKLIFVVLQSTCVAQYNGSVENSRKPSLSPLRCICDTTILTSLLQMCNQISSQNNIGRAWSLDGHRRNCHWSQCRRRKWYTSTTGPQHYGLWYIYTMSTKNTRSVWSVTRFFSMDNLG